MKRPIIPSIGGFAIAIAPLFTFIQPAQAELIVSPEAITIAGDRSRTVSTTLTLSDAQEAANLKLAVSDLRRADGIGLVPSDKIMLDPVEVNVPNDAPAQIRITINLADVSANGEFSGSLYLYRDNSRQIIPLTVRVKAAPWLPWLLMIGGVGLGIALSIYQEEGQPRDEIIVQVSRLKAQMDNDAQLHKDFRASIEAKLSRVAIATDEKDWSRSKTEIAAARNLWQRWQEYDDDWIAQLNYGEQFIQTNQTELDNTDSMFLQGVKDNLDSVYRRLRAGQYDTPQLLSDEFSEIRTQLAFYRASEAEVEQLRERRNKLSGDRADAWVQVLDSLEKKLDRSLPIKVERDKWQELLNTTQEKLEAEIAELASNETDQTQEEPSLMILGRSGAAMVDVDQLTPVPNPSLKSESLLKAEADKKQESRAKINLWWSNQTGRTVAIVFLAWLGMIELYAGKPTFGGEPLRDYFTLLAWGFGAEMTRESVARVTKNLGVSLNNK